MGVLRLWSALKQDGDLKPEIMEQLGIAGKRPGIPPVNYYLPKSLIRLVFYLQSKACQSAQFRLLLIFQAS